jgi:UDP-glucose 4-epimerase
VRLLVTGGAGYVGGAVARRLRAAGHAIVIVDDLRTGHRSTADGFELLVADFADESRVGALLGSERFDGIVHMAASCLVGESVAKPALYRENNLTKSLALLDLSRRHGVARFVFSSSAAVYGEPERVPIDETHPLRPTNPYGETKLAFERALAAHAAAHGLSSVALRYFNAAGATYDGRHGEDHEPETHLVPIVLRAAVEGRQVPVLGTDYPTEDGTAVRDYVHIEDLAEAHRLALGRAAQPGRAEAFNLGTGRGDSVHEVIEAARRVTGRPIAVAAGPRRPGDPARLVAAAGLAARTLGWTPATATLEGILETAWAHLRATGRA